MSKQFYFKQFSSAYVGSLKTQLDVKTVHFKQFSLAQLHSLVLIDLLIEHYKMLPNQVRVYSTFPKAPALLEPYHQIVLCHSQNSH